MSVFDRMVTAEELTRLFKVPASTLRRWASEDGWPRERLRGKTRYSLAAASLTYRRHNMPAREKLRGA